MTFKIGDLVRIVNPKKGSDLIAAKNGIGIIRYGGEKAAYYGVEILSNSYCGHDLGGMLKHKRGTQGWWCETNELELIPKKSNGVYTIGDRVLVKSAVGRKGIKKAKGTIVSFEHPSKRKNIICVMFDIEYDIGGHNGIWHDSRDFGNAENCWWVSDLMNVEVLEHHAPEEPERNELTEAMPKNTDKAAIEFNECVRQVPDAYIYVARDKDGKLFAYVDYPIVDVGGMQFYAKRFKRLDDRLFSELKFENGAVKIREVGDHE